MASSEGDQPLPRAFHAIMDKIEVDILQIEKKWNCKSIFTHQGYFLRKIPTRNAIFVPRYVQLQGRSLMFGTKYKDVPTKLLTFHARTNLS